MEFSDYLQEAIGLVEGWEVPEKDFAQAVNDQVKLMCGLNLETSSDLPRTSPYASLRF